MMVVHFFVLFFSFVISNGIFDVQATYRGQLQKIVPITLPYYPSNFSLSHLETTDPFNKTSNIASFYIASSEPGYAENALAHCNVVNNPRPITYRALPYGIAPELAVINKEPEKPNPLYDAAVKHVVMLQKAPVVVLDTLPAQICLIDNVKTDANQTIQITEPLHDSLGTIAPIEYLTVGITGTNDLNVDGYMFAVVNAHDIAVVKYDKQVIQETVKDYQGKEKTQNKIDYFFNILDAQTGIAHGNKAQQLDEKAISINGGRRSEVTINDICWNPYVERLYIALTVRNSSDTAYNQGSHAVVVGRLDAEQKFIFDAILPDASYQNKDINTMVGVCGPDASLSIHKIRSMLTTTGLPYLILVGNDGKKVSALPLADKSHNNSRADVMNSPAHGTIASKNTQVSGKYLYHLQMKKGKLFGRVCSNEVFDHDDVPTANDNATQVGANKELPNTITDVVIVQDAVFVAVAQAGADQQPGIFHSQAILDKEGKIAFWTPWQRIAGVQEGVSKAIINAEQFFIGYLKSDTPEIVCQITLDIPPNKTRTDEEKSKGDLADFADEYFPRNLSGVQGLFDFSRATPLCGGKRDVSFLIATGYKKIALIESGNALTDVFTGFKEGFFDALSHYQDGCIPAQDVYLHDENKPRVLVIEGGAIAELGAITNAVLVNDGHQSWITIAGSRGVAILCNNDGSGIPHDTGIMPHFVGVNQSMTFKKLGNWKNIKKIIADGSYLYVLTQSNLERVTIAQEIIHNPSKMCSTLIANNLGSLFDVGISGPLCVLASSEGLLVNAGGTDCRYDTLQTMQWNTRLLPQMQGAPYLLFFVSSTDQKNGFGHGGQLYVCAGSLLENITRVYRLFIHDVYSEGVTDTSVELLDDHIFESEPVPIFSYPTYRDHFATNGVHYFSARSRQTQQRPYVHIDTLPYIKNSKTYGDLPFNIPLNIGKVTKNIFALVQNSATGNWIIAGDFGLRIHN